MSAAPSDYRKPVVPADMFPAETRELTSNELCGLWELFHAIGVQWQNTSTDSAGQRSSWTEFVTLRCTQNPSYIAEYENALTVVAALQMEFGESAFSQLFTHALPKQGQLWSRLDHAKKFVVDEFIRMQVVAGGFRGFGSDASGRNRQKHRPLNYNGFVRGSRYNRQVQVRAYPPKARES